MKREKASTLAKWSPFRPPVVELFRDFEEMWKRFFPFFGPRWLRPYFEPEELFSAWPPSVDIEENDHEYLLRAELPGMKKEEVKVKVEGRTLSISGEREQEKEEKDTRHLRVERTYGAFRRSFTLPEAVFPEKLSAEFKDGVLNIHLPKDESAKPKVIEVQVS